LPNQQIINHQLTKLITIRMPSENAEVSTELIEKNVLA